MAYSNLTGPRQLTIRYDATHFATFDASQVTSDGITAPNDVNEITASTFGGDISDANGKALGAATFNIYVKDVSDFTKIFPAGDNGNGTYSDTLGACTSADATIAFTKVCDTKGAIVWKHVNISDAHEVAITRDDVTAIQVSFYRTYAPASDYGVTGDRATALVSDLRFNGTYDPATDQITVDTAEEPEA